MSKSYSWLKLSGKVMPAGRHGSAVAVIAPMSKLSKLAKSSWLFPELEEQLSRALKDLKPDQKEVAKIELHASSGFETRILLVPAKLDAYSIHKGLREVFGAFASNDDLKSLILDVSEMPTGDQAALFEAFAVVLGTAGWKPEIFGKKALEKKSKDAKKKPSDLEVECLLDSSLDSRRVARVAEVAQATAEAINLVRTLGELPGNELHPGSYRERVEKLVAPFGKKIALEFWDTKELKKRGAGAFLAVVAADPATKSGILKLTYRSTKAKKTSHLSLVGKGLCFDTGGYNIKTGSYMYDMHQDMLGSAVALASFLTIVKLGLAVNVTAWLALAENHVSPTAYKPNDVVIAMDGTSIEVIDTDAEGRMVLSDTLVAASQEKPSLILDYATLTGACIRALDTTRSGVFSNQTKLLDEAFKVGESCGERVWGFPSGGPYKEVLKSEIADIRQCADGNNADHIYAATFLGHFVGEVPWIHVDLSSCSNKGGLGLVGTENTGFGVRWTLEMATSHFKL